MRNVFRAWRAPVMIASALALVCIANLKMLAGDLPGAIFTALTAIFFLLTQVAFWLGELVECLREANEDARP